MSGHIGLVVCGAGPASDIGILIDLLAERGFTSRVIATPAGLPFLDVPDLEAKTGHPVRSEYRDPSEPRSGEKIDGYILAPATLNTVTKLGLAISDTYALGVLNEAIGAGTPVVIMPFVNEALAARRPYKKALADLEAEGAVAIKPTPHHRGTGDVARRALPWDDCVATIEQLLAG